MDVSIIIINYNTKKLTQECIESIYEKTRDAVFEVILIDNASTDGSKEELPKLNHENFKYVYNAQNIGFSKANNQGHKLASGEYLFFMNSDMVLINDVVSSLLDLLKKNRAIGIVGPKFLNTDGSLQISCRNFPSIRFGLLKFFPILNLFLQQEAKQYYLNERDYNVQQNVDTVSAGALMISKKLFEKIGCFDEFSFMYAEDADICRKVRDSGYKVVFCPKALLKHYGGQSSKLNSYKAIWSYYLAFYHLYRKYYFKRAAFLIKPLFILRASIAVFLNLYKKDKRITWN